MGNFFGNLFRIATFGESHGNGVGAVVDGCPSGMDLSEADIQAQLARRRPGQSKVTTPRQEADRARIISGVDRGITLGTPIALLVENTDARPRDYAGARAAPRPSHADFTYREKYGILASSGGGRASARETVGRVAGGAIAEKFLSSRFGVEIVAWASAVGEVESPEPDVTGISRTDVDASITRCPDPESSAAMESVIESVAMEGDSVGGIVSCVCRGVPAGWGEPVFRKATALLAQAMMSIPAARGFDVGSGFRAATMRGSEHNDMFTPKGGSLGTITNRSGGIQGGITNGEPILFRVCFKPPATIAKPQETVDFEGNPITLEIGGRHDPCVVARAVPVVESMAALALADLALLARASL